MTFFTKNDDNDIVLELDNGKQIEYELVMDVIMPGYTWPSAKSIVYKEDMDAVYYTSNRPPNEVIEDARKRLEAINS